MTDTQIRCFLKTAEALSFTKAAEELFLSQQAVSKYVSLLEKELGVRLIERGPTLRLTEAGRHYNDFFSETFAELDNIYSRVRASRESFCTSFTIGLSEWIDPFGRLGPVLTQFYLAHANTHFRTEHNTNNAILSGLLSGELDAALFSEGQKPNHRDIDAVPVAWEDVRIHAPMEAIRRAPQPDGWKTCWGEPLFMTSAWEWSPLESKIISARERGDLGLAPPSVEMLPNLNSLLAEMRMGRGCALSDSNFSVISSIEGLGSHALPIRSRLICARRKFDENPLTGMLCSHIAEAFSFSEQQHRTTERL